MKRKTVLDFSYVGIFLEQICQFSRATNLQIRGVFRYVVDPEVARHSDLFLDLAEYLFCIKLGKRKRNFSKTFFALVFRLLHDCLHG